MHSEVVLRVTRPVTAGGKWGFKVDGALVNEPPSWVKEAFLETASSRKKETYFDRNRDKSFSLSCHGGAGETVKLTLELRHQLNIPPITREVRLPEEGVTEIRFPLTKIVKYSGDVMTMETFEDKEITKATNLVEICV